MKDTIVISGFPGTGKSTLFKKYEGTNFVLLDSDSSKFDKVNFPSNYITHIKANIGKADVIFVSSHKAVRDAMTVDGISFIPVFPSKSRKAEFLENYRQRGNTKEFIQLLSDNWDAWIDEMVNKRTWCWIELKTGYLGDIISPESIKLLNNLTVKERF